MDKPANDMIELLRELLEAHERLLAIATARQEAMRTYDVSALNTLLDRERQETAALETLELRRKQAIAQYRATMGLSAELTVSEMAKRTGEPQRTQLLAISGKLKGVMERLERINRVNAKVSSAVIASIGKVLKVITGMAQHAGLYMSNGRKATMKGIHLLDAVA